MRRVRVVNEKFTPFPDCPEFYATHKLMNVKNHRIYSDKFILSMVDLTRIDLATDEYKAYQIDHWARLFRARAHYEYVERTAERLTKENAVLAEENKVLSSENEALKKLLDKHGISF